MIETVKYCLDANVPMTAWNEHYRKDVFPTVWKNLAEKREHIIFITPIFDEIDPKYDSSLSEKEESLRAWLEEKQFSKTPIDKKVEEEAFRLEVEYDTNDGKKGAGFNDIKLIAYAKVTKQTVVTFEKVKKDRPGEKKNYNIPTVCREENVKCIKFIDFLRELKITI